MVKIRFNLNQFTSGFIVPLLILAVAVAGYFILLPRYRDLKEVKQALAAKKQEIAVKEAQLTSVKDLVSDLDNKKERLEILDESLPDAPRVPELLANLEALTQASGLLIATIQITIPPMLSKAESGQDASQFKRLEGILQATENLAVLQIDLILKGKYLNLKSFLASLEQNLRLMDILSFTFTPVNTENQSQEYALKVQTYYYKPLN